MARYGCTVTVAVGKMPSNQSNFAWLLTEDNFPTAAIDGGATSILNGGGNLRCYVDDTKAVQLPIEVVTFVTGVTPDVQVWGLSTTLNVGDTVYIEADTVAVSQPPVTDTYGRNAVWVDFIRVYHLEEVGNTSIGGYADSSGNGDGTGVTPMSQVTGKIGEGAGGDGITSYIDTGFVTDSTAKRLSFWFSRDLATERFACGDRTTSSNRLYAGVVNAGSGNVNLNTGYGNSFSTSSAVASAPNTFYKLTINHDGTNASVRFNGVEIDSYAANAIVASTSTMTILSRQRGGTRDEFLDGGCDEYVIDSVSRSIDYEVSEYNNQSSPSTFWTTSAWEDQDAGGGTIINMPLIGSEAVVFGPEVVVPPVIEMSLVGSEAIVYNPEVLNPLAIDMPLIGQEASIFAFTVTLPLVIEMPLIEGETLVYPPFVVVAGGTTGPIQYEDVVYYRGN